MRRGVLWLGLALATACGGSDEGDTEAVAEDWPATCDSRETTSAEAGICRTWSGEQTAPVDEFESLCTETYGGVFGAEADLPCPDEGVVGYCETDQGFDLALTYTYYAGVWDTESARAHCEGLASCQFSCVFVEP